MSMLNEIRQVVILAAGRSRRMESLSKNEPKCLLPYKGERVLERIVRQIEELGGGNRTDCYNNRISCRYYS